MYRVAWGVIVSLLAVLLVFTFKLENIKTNLFALLPDQSADTGPQKAIPQKTIDSYSEKLSRNVIFLVSARTDTGVIEVTNKLYNEIKDNDVFSKVRFRMNEKELRNLYTSFEAYQFNLIAKQDLKGLEANPEAWLRDKLVNQLVSPVAGMDSNSLTADPFSLYRDFLANLPVGNRFAEIKDGYTFFNTEQQAHILVTAELSGSAFAQDTQDKFEQLLIKLDGDPAFSANVMVFGVIRYALENRVLAQQEMSTIGSGSLIGIILIFFFVFRRLFLLAYILLPISIGILSAFSISLALFGEMHLVSLVFGASLIGVSIDYTLHYCCSHSNLTGSKNANEALVDVRSALTIGLITSSLGYLTLSITDFPALRQMAGLAIAGLAGAYFTVIFWLPALIKKPLMVQPNVVAWVEKLTAWLQQRKEISVWLILITILLSYSTNYIIKNSQDDIKIMRAQLPELDEIEVRMQTVLGEFPNSQFFLVQAKNTVAVMANERRLVKQLKAMNLQGGRVSALSEWLPDASVQRHNLQLLRQSILANEKLNNYIIEAGLPVDLLNSYRARLAAAKDTTMDAEEFVASPLGRLHSHLWLGKIDDHYYSIVSLFGYKDLAALNKLAESMPAVHFIDRSASVSRLFEKYRIIIEKMFHFVLLAIFLLLGWRYGLQDAFRIVSAPLLSALFSFIVMNLVIGEYNLFSIFGLIITIAISIDYAVFIKESTGNCTSTYLAITLAGLTTILALGLLSLSQTPALSTFGLSLLLGVLFSYILTPLIVRPNKVMA